MSYVKSCPGFVVSSVCLSRVRDGTQHLTPRIMVGPYWECFVFAVFATIAIWSVSVFVVLRLKNVLHYIYRNDARQF